MLDGSFCVFVPVSNGQNQGDKGPCSDSSQHVAGSVCAREEVQLLLRGNLQCVRWAGTLKNKKKQTTISFQGVTVEQNNIALNFCLTVWEPGSGVWEVGNHGAGGTPQVLRRDGQAEAEAAVFYPPKRVGVGGWLVHRPREGVSSQLCSPHPFLPSSIFVDKVTTAKCFSVTTLQFSPSEQNYRLEIIFILECLGKGSILLTADLVWCS